MVSVSSNESEVNSKYLVVIFSPHCEQMSLHKPRPAAGTRMYLGEVKNNNVNMFTKKLQNTHFINDHLYFIFKPRTTIIIQSLQ